MTAHGHDAARWDQRYAATTRLWSATPNGTVAELTADLEPGTALDVATGEGRHAAWLAGRGWRVTAVDFATVGVDRGRANTAELGDAIRWVVADVRQWSPPPGTTYDLVLVAFLHMPANVFVNLRGLLAPGGALVVVGHALRNLTEGVGGPSDPALLYTEDVLREAATGLSVERLGEVERETPEGTAIDVCLRARNTRT